MRKNDIQLLSEAYCVTRQPKQTVIIESQLEETLEILQEGMWDRLKSDAAGATAGMGKKALGTIGRAATLGIGGKYNPFNKMVAQGRQAGQEARAGSLGKSHMDKLTKEMTKVTQAFNKAIDNYISDMEKQKLIAPGQVNQQTNAVKTEFGNSLQKSQQTVDGLVQQATSMTQAGKDGKTQGGMAQQQVGGAGIGKDAGLTGAATAINKNVIQPGMSAAQQAGIAAKDAVVTGGKAVGDALGTAATATRDALNKAPGALVQGVGDLAQQVQDAPGQIKNRFQQGQADAQARAGTAPVPPATPGADTTAKAEETAEELKKRQGQPQPVGEEAEEEVEEDEEVVEDQIDPLNPVFPYTYLNESNVQAYADNMNPGWQRDDLKSGRDSRLL